MPPSSWIDFDPTSNKFEESLASQKQTVAHSMLKGEDPADVRKQAINVASFIEREVRIRV